MNDVDCIAVNHEFVALKARLKNMWMAGDYDVFCKPMQPSAEQFLKRIRVLPGATLLDVACGSGQVALAAARGGAQVTGIDIADNLVERARELAKAESLEVRFDQGDAESLPYGDAAFDYVVSAIGAMFAPTPERVASELVRVCKPGGTIAMANWTAEGFVGKMFRAIAAYIAPPGMPSPLLWGNETVVRERFCGMVDSLFVSRQQYLFEYPFPPAGVVEFFAAYYGPMNRAFAELEPAKAVQLRRELVELWTLHNEAADGRTQVQAEYLEVIARRTTYKNSDTRRK